MFQFLRFVVVGGVGFVIDAGGLLLLVHLGGDPYLSRLITFPVAVCATWALNSRWTFAAQSPRAKTKTDYSKYFAVQIGGALTNFVVYSLYLAATSELFYQIAVGILLGSIAGLVFNYTLSSRAVFTAE